MQKLKYILLSFIILLILWLIYSVTYIQAEPKAYDFMMKNVVTQKLPLDKWKNVDGHDDIVLIMVDLPTAEKYRWPWKREMWCPIFDYLSTYSKPKVVIFDAIIATLDKDYPESDNKFFNTIKRMNNLIVGFLPQKSEYKDSSGLEYDKLFIDKFGIKTENLKEFPKLYSSIVQFPREYFNIIKHSGSVMVFPGAISGNLNRSEYDEIHRNHQAVSYYKGVTLPSLAMEAFIVGNNNPKMFYDRNYISFPDLNYRFYQKTSELQMTIPIKFYKLTKGYSHIKYSAIDIMNSYNNLVKGKKPQIDPNLFNDKYVFIGINIPTGNGANDIHNTPMNANHSGTDMQASALDNIVHNDFLKIIPDSINIFVVLIGMLFIYLIIRLNDLFKSISYSILFIVGYFLFACTCYYFSVVINVITPIVMFVITMIGGYTHKFILENRSKEKVKSAMGKYMSQDVMKRVVQNIDNLGLGGKKATVTVLFSDIRGFTSMSENMTALEVSQILNEYFSEIEPIITKYNGIINKFIGDAVMAIFGEPIQDKNHAVNAVKCGYEMLEKVKELHKKWSLEGKPLIEIGVGINTGEVFVGNIGSSNRMEYTVIGDTVNLASRLESYNKIYKTKMLISSSTYNEAKGILDVIKISDVEIRGKANKMDIYEVLRII